MRTWGWRTPRAGLVWLFDLDNTLHDASTHIFPRISEAMMRYVMQHLGMDEPSARAIRDRYWKRYGATLTGLVQHHGVNAAHFLRETHPFPDLGRLLKAERGLARHLRALPGRKVVFSNAPRHYVRDVVKELGIVRELDGVWGIEDLRLTPKPQLPAYRRVRGSVRATRVIMVEDTLANLRPAKRMGMGTVWITRQRRPAPSFVDVKISSIRELRRFSWLQVARKR